MNSLRNSTAIGYHPLTSKEVRVLQPVGIRGQSRTRTVCGFFVGTTIYGGAGGRVQTLPVFAPRVPRSANPSALPPDFAVGRQSFNGTLEAIMASSSTGNSAKTTAFISALTGANAPRALLVSLDRNGQLEHTPVAFGESVLNIETDLQDHLSAQPVSTEWMLNLCDYIDQRLASRGEARATGGVAIPRQDGAWAIAHINAFTPLTLTTGKAVSMSI